MQDVAYAITKLKYDSGKTKTLSHAILAAKYSHVIASDIFRDATRANLKPCLKELCLDYWSNWNQQHSLAGLDDITADGMNSFSILEKVINLYLKDKNLVIYLRKENILKIQYPVNCEDENSSFITHNLILSLFDITNQLLVSSESNTVNSSGSWHSTKES